MTIATVKSMAPGAENTADGRDWIAVEIKSSRTPSSDYLSSLEKLKAQLRVADRMAPPIENVVVYAGESSQKRKAGQFLPWRGVDSFPWA